MSASGYEERYNVVVSGVVLDGFELQHVKESFSKLFSLAEDKTDQIFSKGNVVIKKDVAENVANQFISKLESIGAAAHLLPISNQQPLNQSASIPPSPTQSQPINITKEIPSKDFIAEESSDESNKRLKENIAAAMLAEESPISSDQTSYTPQSSTEAKEKIAAAMSAENSALPFSFYGNGSEYFRIWIVNILLTIVTLGIYSAWAKVRNAQYFYGHTEVANSRFAYLANPLTILKGRIIAVVIFAIYSVVSNLYPTVGIGLGLLFTAVLPWVAIRSLRFNRRMTAWRNIRFGFDGTLWPAIQVFLLWPLAGILTLGLLMPLAMYKQRQFIIDNTRYGTAKFNLVPCYKKFYMIYIAAGGVFLAALLIGGGLNLITPVLTGITSMVAYLYLMTFISVRSTNLTYNNTVLHEGSFSFHSNWRDMSYLKMVVINSLLTLLTLGFYLPWAKVRVAHYSADHLVLNTHADLDGFIAAEEDNISALGEELGDVFDMDVGF